MNRLRTTTFFTGQKAGPICSIPDWKVGKERFQRWLFQPPIVVDIDIAVGKALQCRMIGH